MNYFQPFALAPDETIVAAWDSQMVEAAETPWLARVLATRSAEVFPRFAACYAQLRALPRGARRALQRQLARSGDLAEFLPEWLQGQAGHSLRQKLARSLAGAALLLALGQGLAQAGTINVTAKTPPAVNSGDLKCSLIEAIINANAGYAFFSDCPGATFGPNTINLPKGTQTLTYAYPGYYSATGLPLITSQITIQGNSSKIVRKKSAPGFRLIAVPSSGNLTLNSVTLSGGNTSYGGGAIFNAGYLTINSSTISGNTAVGGGAISNYNGYLTINSSTISKNVASNSGGGIFNYASYPGNYGTLVLNSTTVTGNKATKYGGGIFSLGTYADVYINNSTISKNSATYGGGIYNVYGYVSIDPSTVTGNKANVGGGATNFKGTLYMNQVTLSKNSAKYAGGGVANAYGTFHIYSSIITGNKAILAGGGILNFHPVNFSHSGNTYSKNKAHYGPDVYNVY